MKSSTLAALIAIAAGLYIWFSPRRPVSLAIVLSCITLGYLSGCKKTTFGGWISGIVDIVKDAINMIASAF